MKGLASVLIATLILSVTAAAGPLEFAFGAGPSAFSLSTMNASVGVFNALITHLNETVDVHPDLSGTVELLAPLSSGISLYAGERFWLTDWLGLGASIDYFRTSTATLGHYQGAEVSTIDVNVDMTSVGVLLGARATFVDLGLRLSADAAAGYFLAVSNRSVTFEIPAEYPDVISGVPPDGTGRYSGGAFGFELGLSLSYPIAEWFAIGTTVAYRSAHVPTLLDSAGVELDIDGDGQPEPAELGGITVRLTFSLSIDLGLGEDKE